MAGSSKSNGRPQVVADVEQKLEEIQEAMGIVPNLLKRLRSSPAALEAMWAQLRALDESALPERWRAAIALRCAELLASDYCLAAHTARAEQLGIDYATIIDFRIGVSDDPKEQAVLALAARLVQTRGQDAQREIVEARVRRLSDCEVVEVITQTALCVSTALMVNALEVDLDAPAAPQLIRPPAHAEVGEPFQTPAAAKPRASALGSILASLNAGGLTPRKPQSTGVAPE